MKRQTNYVIVVDFDQDNNYFEDQFLLGWNSMYDWYDTDTVGDELIYQDGSIKLNEFGLIKVSWWVTVYASDESGLPDLQDHCKDSIKENLNSTVCKLEKNSNGEWIVVPV
jgi:hypothetical protein